VVGGLVVHLGIGDGKLTAALKQNSGTLVHGLDKDDAKVNAARDWMRAANVYGQVAVDKELTTPVLPYLDGMINLIVVEDQLGLSNEELNRVLVPQGVIIAQPQRVEEDGEAEGSARWMTGRTTAWPQWQSGVERHGGRSA